MEERKELNLFDLIRMFFNWLGRIFKNLFKGLGNCLQLTYQYFWLVIPITILGLVAAFFYSQPSNRIYKIEGMAMLNGPTSYLTKEIAKPLEWAMPKNVYENQSFGTLCNLPDSITHNIRRFQTLYVIDCLNDSTPDFVDYKQNHDLSDTTNVRMPNYIYFTYRTKRADQIPAVEKGLLHYFNTHPLMQQWNVTYRKNLKENIETYKNQLAYLDSLSKRSYLEAPVSAQLNLKYNTLLIGEQEKQMFHEDIAILQHRKYTLEQDLVRDTMPMIFTTHLSAKPQAINSRLKSCALGLIGGYILAICIALLVKYRKNILHYLETK